jgi:TolA-binding protein
MDYATTPAAADAAAAVKIFDDDAAFQRKLRETNAASKAHSLLNLAQTYHTSNRDDLARKKYQEIIDKFPDTSFADQAKAAMAQLPNSK